MEFKNLYESLMEATGLKGCQVEDGKNIWAIDGVVGSVAADPVIVNRGGAGTSGFVLQLQTPEVKYEFYNDRTWSASDYKGNVITERREMGTRAVTGENE